MRALLSSAEIAFRLAVRTIFDFVDGPALVKLSRAPNKSDLSNSLVGIPSSIYAIPLFSDTCPSKSLLEFGPIHDPELMGGRESDDAGMLLWASHQDGHPFLELAKLFGYSSATYRYAELGIVIDLGIVLTNNETIEIAMKMVKAVVESFDLNDQELAAMENRRLKDNPEILQGFPDSRISTI